MRLLCTATIFFVTLGLIEALFVIQVPNKVWWTKWPVDYNGTAKVSLAFWLVPNAGMVLIIGIVAVLLWMFAAWLAGLIRND